MKKPQNNSWKVIGIVLVLLISAVSMPVFAGGSQEAAGDDQFEIVLYS